MGGFVKVPPLSSTTAPNTMLVDEPLSFTNRVLQLAEAKPAAAEYDGAAGFEVHKAIL